MKKYLHLLILAIALVSCEEDDSPIMFTIVDNTSPQNVKVEYYSPDPSCVPRRYRIVTNRLQGELTLKSNDVKNLFLAEPRENSRTHFGVTETGETDYSILVCDEGKWSVSLTADDYLRFVFNETPANPDLDFVFENDYVIVRGKKGKKEVETSIEIWRSLNDDSPML